MAAFSSLSADQQAAVIDHVDSLVRPTVLSAAGTIRRMANATTDEAARGVGTLLASLDAGTVIPTHSGLSGAQALAVEDVQAILADFGSILSAYATAAQQQRWARAAGSVNVLNA